MFTLLPLNKGKEQDEGNLRVSIADTIDGRPADPLLREEPVRNVGSDPVVGLPGFITADLITEDSSARETGGFC
ncbi:MAG: hypothetical protein Q8J78_09985 [Moraxellaceae bacterium]|nr:hypothetical protein [Moraxellaceae bacterium]